MQPRPNRLFPTAPRFTPSMPAILSAIFACHWRHAPGSAWSVPVSQLVGLRALRRRQTMACLREAKAHRARAHFRRSTLRQALAVARVSGVRVDWGMRGSFTLYLKRGPLGNLGCLGSTGPGNGASTSLAGGRGSDKPVMGYWPTGA